MENKATIGTIIKENWKLTIHKFWVFVYVAKVCCALLKRALRHDLSKYSKHEAPFFAKANELKTLQFGTEEYVKNLKTIQPALEHHYKNNSHHPQHYINGVDGMSLLDVCEMLCDWKAATRRTKNGNIKFSLEENQERFMYSDDTKDKFINFLRESKLWRPSYNIYRKKDSKGSYNYTMVPDDAGWIYEQCEKECELIYSSLSEKKARRKYESILRSSTIKK